jgi:hypothetical protein
MIVKVVQEYIKPLVFPLFFTIVITCSYGQSTNLDDYIESIIENLDSDLNFDFNTLYEIYEYRLSNPIHLNRATSDELQELLFLSDIETQSIISYREEHGDFISIYELQAVPNLSLKNIDRLSDFITIGKDGSQYQQTFSEMLKTGKHEMFFRNEQILEKVKGQTRNDDGVKAFEGNPSNYYFRYRYNTDNRLRFGLTAEKDAGEAFFNKSNTTGFDFYSFHFHLKNVLKGVKDLSIGDYTLNFGQGLTVHNSFGGTKSALVNSIKKNGQVIRPYSSRGETIFLRGIATTIDVSKAIDVTGFISYKNEDANISLIDTTDTDDLLVEFSSIRQDGFHRTESEIEDENSLQRITSGARIEYSAFPLKIAGNIVLDHFENSFNPQNTVANLFRFRGSSLLNTSIDYSYKWKNVNLFGEAAYSNSKGTAQLYGALIALNRKTDISILYRDYSREYQSLLANAFGESSTVNNEKGIYVGFNYEASEKWQFSLYFDQWENPWLRSRVDTPATGTEYLARLTYTPGYKYNSYFQYRYEKKQRNLSDNQTPTDVAIPTTLHRWRFNQQIQLTRKFELRNRLEFSLFEDHERSAGIFIAQDIFYRTRKINFSTRIAYFNTEDFDSRIYAFESDLLYSFSIPFFWNEGFRFYINSKWKINYKLTAEFRIARSQFLDIDEIGSGNNLISGNSRTDIKAQLRYKF